MKVRVQDASSEEAQAFVNRIADGDYATCIIILVDQDEKPSMYIDSVHDTAGLLYDLADQIDEQISSN